MQLLEIITGAIPLLIIVAVITVCAKVFMWVSKHVNSENKTLNAKYSENAEKLEELYVLLPRLFDNSAARPTNLKGAVNMIEKHVIKYEGMLAGADETMRADATTKGATNAVQYIETLFTTVNLNRTAFRNLDNRRKEESQGRVTHQSANKTLRDQTILQQKTIADQDVTIAGLRAASLVQTEEIRQLMLKMAVIEGKPEAIEAAREKSGREAYEKATGNILPYLRPSNPKSTKKEPDSREGTSGNKNDDETTNAEAS